MSLRRSVGSPKGRQNLHFSGIFFMTWSSVRFELAAAESGCGWLPTACNLTAAAGGQRLWTTS